LYSVVSRNSRGASALNNWPSPQYHRNVGQLKTKSSISISMSISISISISCICIVKTLPVTVFGMN